MSGLTKIIGGDLGKVGSFAEGVIKGVPSGFYTPFMLNSGLKRLRKQADSNSGPEHFGSLLSQIEIAIFSQMFMLSYAAKHDRVAEYLGILLLTNLGDYFINAYRRANAPDS